MNALAREYRVDANIFQTVITGERSPNDMPRVYIEYMIRDIINVDPDNLGVFAYLHAYNYAYTTYMMRRLLLKKTQTPPTDKGSNRIYFNQPADFGLDMANNKICEYEQLVRNGFVTREEHVRANK